MSQYNNFLTKFSTQTKVSILKFLAAHRDNDGDKYSWPRTKVRASWWRIWFSHSRQWPWPWPWQGPQPQTVGMYMYIFFSFSDVPPFACGPFLIHLSQMTPAAWNHRRMLRSCGPFRLKACQKQSEHGIASLIALVVTRKRRQSMLSEVWKNSTELLLKERPNQHADPNNGLSTEMSTETLIEVVWINPPPPRMHAPTYLCVRPHVWHMCGCAPASARAYAMVGRLCRHIHIQPKKTIASIHVFVESRLVCEVYIHAHFQVLCIYCMNTCSMYSRAELGLWGDAYACMSVSCRALCP